MKAVILAAACAVGLATSSASAASVAWSFSNLVFDDGGTASGQFVWDSQANAVESWTVNTTEEVGNANFPAFTYSDTIAGHVATKEFGTQSGLRFLQFASPTFAQQSGVDRARVFRLGIGFGGLDVFDVLDTPGAALNLISDSGAAIPFVPGGFVECLFCSPFRLGTTDGSVALTPTTATVPLPAALPALSAALLIVGAIARRRRPSRAATSPASGG